MPENLAPSKGRIDTATLPVVVRDLWRAQASGTLYLENGTTTKQIFFRRGEIVFAATNVEYERLGERLVRAGKIKRSVLELAVRVMERSHQRIGKTISEWGWLSSNEIERWVATQIREIIYSVFTWSSGLYRFEPAEDPIASDLTLELATAEVVYEGARRTSDLKAIRAGVGPPSSILRLSEGERLGIPVTKDEGVILSRIDGRSTILDIVSDSPLAEEETLRRVYALMLAGVVSRDDSRKLARSRPSRSTADADGAEPSDDEKRFRDAVTARHAAMKFGNFYDRLGVDSGASETKIRQAYEEVVHSLDPDPEFASRLGNIDKRLQEVRDRVEEAFRALADPDSRRAYDRHLSGSSSEATVAAATFAVSSPPVPSSVAAKKVDKDTSRKVVPPAPASAKAAQEAELQYLEANRFWQSGDYFDAVATMSEAVRLDPSKSKYHRALGLWLAENPSCAEAAQEQFELAIVLDPKDREAHEGLAKLFEQEGLQDKARKLLERVAELEPSAAAEISRR